jgi:hypothetical protein
MKSNSGSEKAPSPKAVSVFKGIKGLVASGPGKTKSPVIANLHRPEGAVHIDAGNLKPASGMKKSVAGSPKSISMGSGHKGIHIGVGMAPGAAKHDEQGVISHK